MAEKLTPYERISIMLYEYNTLREEMNHIRGNTLTWVVILASNVTICLGFLNNNPSPSWKAIFIGVIVILFAIIIYIVIQAQIGSLKIVKRITKIEKTVNHIAREELLVWENRFGWGSMFLINNPNQRGRWFRS